jgi:23S rRNA-/tRNA-specific pseudouridylate synthase
MNWLGYPVLGDWLYKGASAPRLMLHAVKLEFKNPFSAKKLKFEAAPPADFNKAWEEKTK